MYASWYTSKTYCGHMFIDVLMFMSSRQGERERERERRTYALSDSERDRGRDCLFQASLCVYFYVFFMCTENSENSLAIAATVSNVLR